MTTPPPDLSALRISRDEPEPSPRSGALRAGLAAFAVVVAIGSALFLSRRAPVTVHVAEVGVTGGGVGASAGPGITANGYVVARTKASVSARIMGRMVYLGVHEGSRVKEGEVIARLESNDVAAAVNAATANAAQIDAQLGQARRDLERAQALAQQQVLSAADLENARTRVGVLQAQLGSARAQVQLARANFENTRVRAPFAGTVLRKDAEVGEVVAPSAAGGGMTRTSIVTMADLATLEVEVDVNEAYIAQIRGSQPARITLDAYPDTSFTGEVRQVVPTADRQKATVQVKVAITDRDPRILPEMGAKVTFLRAGADSAAAAAVPRRVTVPVAALAKRGTQTLVWVVQGGRVTSTPIETGTERDEGIEVRSGLSGGETVVVQPGDRLRDGQKVKIAK